MTCYPFLAAILTACLSATAALRTEQFNSEPSNWEGINNRNSHFPPRIVTQDFGYIARGSHFGAQRGEIGGKLNPAGEPAYYAFRLPRLFTLQDRLRASGKLFVQPGPGHFLLGFFNTNSLNEWRTANSMVMRINGRGESFHCHLEFCTSRWRSSAGVVGEIVPGERIDAKALPCGTAYDWVLEYEPARAGDSALLKLTFGTHMATCKVEKDHLGDGAAFTHFGLLPIPKTWDSPGQAWIADVTINGRHFDLSHDPNWDGVNNRRTYESKDTRPKFDFGWSPTHHAGGAAPGELGGLIFRGDCREPARMGAYGDRIGLLTLKSRLYARGKVSMLRGISDSTASIGFYHSKWSLQTNASQSHSIPLDYLGINIEGPSSEGFFFYPVFRAHGDVSKAYDRNMGPVLRIYPDRKVHDWELLYDPATPDRDGQITVRLDGQSCKLNLDAAATAEGASFDRFGICTPWIDGNSVTVYFDDLQYTSGE